MRALTESDEVDPNEGHYADELTYESFCVWTSGTLRSLKGASNTEFPSMKFILQNESHGFIVVVSSVNGSYKLSKCTWIISRCKRLTVS